MWGRGRKPLAAVTEQKPLIEVFGSRPDRFALLKQGTEKVGLGPDDFVVEVGCARGDGTFFLTENNGCSVLGVDMEEQYIAEARQRLRENGSSLARFAVARAERLPLGPQTVDLVVSEAAYSLLPDKMAAAGEFWRVLKPGGHVIINDFKITNEVAGELRDKMSYIPCFAGVGRADDYCAAFEQAGFTTSSVSDESKELIRTALWIGKAYKSRAADISCVFAGLLSGPAPQNTIETHSNDCREFFRLARLGYVQAIFKKQPTWAG